MTIFPLYEPFPGPLWHLVRSRVSDSDTAASGYDADVPRQPLLGVMRMAPAIGTVIIRLFATVAMVSLAIGLAGCGSGEGAEPVAITQCFQKIGVPFDRSKDEFFLDKERGCYGQRWKIPKGYYSEKYISYHPLTESLVIEVGYPDLTPGALIPSSRKVRLSNEVKIVPLFTGDFQKRVREVKESMRVAAGLEKTDRILFDMRVYETTKTSTYRYVFLFADKDADLYAQCVTMAGATIDQQKPNNICTVVSNVDEKVTIGYHLKFSDMGNVAQHNSEIVKLVRGFMVAQQP